MPIDADGLITQPRKSSTPNIIQGRSMEWVRKMFGFDVWNDIYQGKNFFVGTYPFPGSSRFREDDISAQVLATPGTGMAITMQLGAPQRGTLRRWIVVSMTTDDTNTADSVYGYMFGGTEFAAGGGTAGNDDDPMSVLNVEMCSGMTPFWRREGSTVGKVYHLRGLSIDYPEGEAPSMATPFSMSI